jgi:hypothetical protein
MRSTFLRAVLLAPLLMVAVVLPAAPADAGHHGIPGLQISPQHVSFGPVAVGAPGCTVQEGVLVGCVTATVTLTNTGSEALLFDSFSTCDKVFPDSSCSQSGPSWGGEFRDNTPGACSSDFFDFVLDPGESCYLLLFAVPEVEGLIKGFIVVRTHAGPEPLDLDFEKIRVTVRGV